jgi:hypothetical protein
MDSDRSSAKHISLRNEEITLHFKAFKYCYWFCVFVDTAGSRVAYGTIEQIKKTQDELQWIVAQRLLSALTIPGFS